MGKGKGNYSFMEFEVGSIVTGKVTGITKFGAFVALAPGKSGLVHISEVANSYVSDINEFLAVGQEVSVKIINIDQNGRLNLSIKQTQPAPQRPARPRTQPAAKPQQAQATAAPAPAQSAPTAQPAAAQGELLGASNNAAFEDKLKKFMQDSDSKMSGVRIYSENKRSGRRRR